MNDKGEILTETGEGRLDHLRGLMPMVRSLLERSGASRQDIRGIAVSVGPGSFTGIHIGAATARTLAQVFSVPVFPVNTLASMAFNAFAAGQEDSRMPAAEDDAAAGAAAAVPGAGSAAEVLVVPMIDARRGQVYAAAYGLRSLEPRIREDAWQASEFLELVARYAAGHGLRRLLFCGDGAEVCRERIAEMFPVNGNDDVNSDGKSSGPVAEIVTGPAAVQNAEGVLRAGLQVNAEGGAVSYEDVRAVYLRKAEAERKRETGRLGRKKKPAEPEQILEMPPADGQIQYRLLDEKDLDALAALDGLCFEKSWSRHHFEGDLAGSRPAAYAGAFNSREELIGFAGIVYLLGEGDVNRVAVHPLYRTGGIGGRCLEMAMEQARWQGTEKLLLEVKEGNRSAISLYKDHGFRVISKRKGYYSDTGENALIMQKTFEGETV